MKKVRLVVEIDIDENEIKQISDHTNNYKNSMTFKKYVDGLNSTYHHSRWGISNPIDDYFNENIGTSDVIQDMKIVEKLLLNNLIFK